MSLAVSFHFLPSFLVSFFSLLRFSLWSSFVSWLRFTPIFFFRLLCRGCFSDFFSQYICHWYIERLLIFVLILYPSTLLKVSISYGTFLVLPIGSLFRTISANRDTLTSSFPISFYFLIFLKITLGKIFSMWTWVKTLDTLVLILILLKYFNICLFILLLTIGLLYITIIILKITTQICSLYPYSPQSFYHEAMWYFANGPVLHF